MKKARVNAGDGFSVIMKKSRSEAAAMVLDAGESTGGPDNRHEQSDQWMYVISGEARAKVGGSEVELAPGDLLLIEKGETHEIRNSGKAPFKTLNFYVPPAY